MFTQVIPHRRLTIVLVEYLATLLFSAALTPMQ